MSDTIEPARALDGTLSRKALYCPPLDAHTRVCAGREEDMIDINIHSTHGITVGARKDGSRAVLWDDNTIQWFTAVEFNDLMISIEVSEMLGA